MPQKTKEEVSEIIKETFSSLQRSGIIAEGTEVNDETVILGAGSFLDSIGFITFITELEDRLSAESTDGIFIVLNDISDFNINNPYLTAGSLANYIQGLFT